MEEPKKRRWSWTLVLCVVLVGLNLRQGMRISDLEQDIWNAQNSVMDNVNQISQRFSSLSSELERANDLVGDWSYTSSIDMERRGLDIVVSVVLKEWQEDTAVKLLCGGDGHSEIVVPLTGDGAGAFTGTMELMPSEFSGEYTLDAVIAKNDGTQRRESLGWLGDFASLLPLQCGGWGAGGPRYRDGVFDISHVEVDIFNDRGDVPEGIRDAVFRIKQNGKAVEEGTAMQGDRMGSFTYDGEWSVECRPGDALTLTFFCRDESGLGYEFFLEGWTIREDGPDYRAPEVDWPKLTWS